MTLNIHKKINEIFADEFLDNKIIIFSPKKQIPSKFTKNLQDNILTMLKKEKEEKRELSNSHENKYNSTKSKKKQIKKIKDINDTLKQEGKQYLNKDVNIIHNRSKDKDIMRSSVKTYKLEKKENKNDAIENNNENADIDSRINKNEKRTRGKSHHANNKILSHSNLKDILHRDKEKEVKKKKSKFEEKEAENEKIEENKEEENKKSEDEEKEKKKKKSIFA